MSEAIKQLVEIAKGEGLEAHASQWSKAFVHWFDRPMPQSVREAAEAHPSLEYSKDPEVPWTPAHEQFFDPATRIAIVFETGK